MEGAYKYAAGPYAVAYNTKLYVYGTGTEGTGYYNTYDGASYSPPQKVNGSEQAEAYQPYAVDYGGYANVFYVTQDGKVYWNRYNGTAYTGADGHAYYNACQNGSWGGWQDLGGNYAYEPTQYEYGGKYYLTYAGGGGPAVGPTQLAQPSYADPTPTPTY